MLKCEIRADNTLHIEGYVNAVERDSKPIIVSGIGKCVEQVRAGVFGAALAGNPMVEILENHDRNRKLGSTSDGALSLSEDSIGLRASADISDADIVEKARAGQLKGWSFGFIAKSQEIEQRAGNIPRRVITGMALTEVSLVDGKYSPCYLGTLVEVRAADTAGETEVVEFRADEEIEVIDAAGGEPEPAAELDFEPDPDYSYYERAMKLLELRYNPYHDPSNGRFCSGGGGGGGGVLYVGKGQKGKGIYVVDVDHDDEYEQWKASKNGAKRELDSKQIHRANAQGSLFYEAGTAIKNTYDREYDEIGSLNISDKEKTDARNKIYEYSASELQALQGYYDLYTVGPARKVSGSDKAFDKSQKIRGKHEAYMSSLREKSSKNTYKAQEEKEAELHIKASAEAYKTGAREMTVNGETWFRTTKTSKTWTKGTLRDYKAQQAYNKTQKGLWMGDPRRKSWSSLTDEEKKPYYN